jgi:hypothetical protein
VGWDLEPTTKKLTAVELYQRNAELEGQAVHRGVKEGPHVEAVEDDVTALGEGDHRAPVMHLLQDQKKVNLSDWRNKVFFKKKNYKLGQVVCVRQVPQFLKKK